MKKYFVIILIMHFCIVVKSQLLIPTGYLNHARTGHCSELLNNGKILAFGGDYITSSTSTVLKSAEIYNSGVWTNVADMNEYRDQTCSALLSNGNVIVIGGSNGTAMLSSCEIYNVATNTWTYTDSMNTPRYGAKAVVLNNGKILVVGGNYEATCELYDQTTNTWSPTGSLSGERFYFDVVKLPNGNVMRYGGIGIPDTAEIYDVTTEVWTKVSGPLNYPASNSSSILMNNGKILIVSGNYEHTEVFDPSNNTSSITGDLLISTKGKMINLTDGRVLIYGTGSITTPLDLKALQVYDPVSGTWSSAGLIDFTYKTASNYTVHRLPNNKIIYIGGIYGSMTRNNCYLVDENNILTSMNENDKNRITSYQVFPNPAKDIITLNVNEEMLGLDYYIINQLGLSVASGRILNTNSIINIGSLVNGEYIIRIGENKTQSCSFFKY